ncbi:hypothetical protein L7F22_045805 [Adiantum nelumboides]|nr:hypothetical protein [Adiantum nelumboides]
MTTNSPKPSRRVPSSFAAVLAAPSKTDRIGQLQAALDMVMDKNRDLKARLRTLKARFDSMIGLTTDKVKEVKAKIAMCISHPSLLRIDFGSSGRSCAQILVLVGDLVHILLPDIAARTSKFELFVTRFYGSDFAWWSSHMLDALTFLGQALPLQGKDARPESMSDSEWEDLDALARLMVMLNLVESVYCIVMHACTTRDVWQLLCQRYGTSESKDVLRVRCRMRQRKGQHRLDATTLTTSEENVVYEVTHNGEVVLASMCTPELEQPASSCETQVVVQALCPSVDSHVARQESSDSTMTCVDDRHFDALKSFTDTPLPMSESLSHGTSCVDVIAREIDACEPCMAMLFDTESIYEPNFREPETDVLFYDASDMFEDDSVLQTPMHAHDAEEWINRVKTDLEDKAETLSQALVNEVLIQDNEDKDDDDDDDEDADQTDGTFGHDQGPDDDDNQDDPPSGTGPSTAGPQQHYQTLLVPKHSHLHQHQKVIVKLTRVHHILVEVATDKWLERKLS